MIDRYVEREIKEKFDKLVNLYGAIALVGARQSGKTTFLKRQMKKHNASYILFDDPDPKDLFEKDIKKFELQYMEGHDITILDEIQYYRDAGSKLKYLVDNGRKLWITSSSEILLSKEILSYLVGRVSILRLYPFSLREFLSAKNIKVTTETILKRAIWEHAIYGGYPKVVLEEDIEMKRILLRDLYETMLLKDVARNFSISDIGTLERLSKYLSLSISEIISYERLSTSLDASFKTIKRYLDAMEKSYLIKRVQPFYTNKKKELTKQPKIFFVDTGLRNVIANQYELDGKLFENYVFTELLKLDLEPKYWRTKAKAEVDFVVEIDGDILPIEVKLRYDGKIEKSLRSFISAYKPKNALIISYEGVKDEIKVNNCKVNVIWVDDLPKILKQKSHTEKHGYISYA
ncbi:MAG TPA: ATP-binding protein [Thermoplasmatales archaeon]|nr:ATP-binding protein [Thermoplasmatales archaeon]